MHVLKPYISLWWIWSALIDHKQWRQQQNNMNILVLDSVQCPVCDPAVATWQARIWPHPRTHNHYAWLMGPKMNPVCLSQVSLFLQLSKGRGQVVTAKWMVPPERRAGKQVPHSETRRFYLYLAFPARTYAQRRTHARTKRNHFQLSVTALVYLDKSGILSNFNL